MIHRLGGIVMFLFIIAALSRILTVQNGPNMIRAGASALANLFKGTIND